MEQPIHLNWGFSDADNPFSQNCPTVAGNTKVQGGFWALIYFYLSASDSVQLLFH